MREWKAETMFSSFKPYKPVYSYLGETWWDIIGTNFYRGTNWHDTARGFSGDDRLFMGRGNDTAYGGTGDDDIHGEDGNDLLFGDAGDDEVYAGQGNDSLFGGDDNDLLMGSYGADFIDGGAGIDTVMFHGNPDGFFGVNVNLEKGTASGADAEGDVIVNVENIQGSQYDDTITGDDQDNTLLGGRGDDVVNGGDGDDVLVGGKNAGNGAFGDIMTGGAGSDQFRFLYDYTDSGGDSPSTERDVITDFVRGEDIINLADLGVGEATFSGLQNDFLTQTGSELVFNWPAIPVFGAATLIKFRDAFGDVHEFYVLGNQSLSADDFIF